MVGRNRDVLPAESRGRRFRLGPLVSISVISIIFRDKILCYLLGTDGQVDQVGDRKAILLTRAGISILIACNKECPYKKLKGA